MQLNDTTHYRLYLFKSKQKEQGVIKIWFANQTNLNFSNKLTNKTQQFHKFITSRLCVAQHVSGASSPIIRSVQLH